MDAVETRHRGRGDAGLRSVNVETTRRNVISDHGLVAVGSGQNLQSEVPRTLRTEHRFDVEQCPCDIQRTFSGYGLFVLSVRRTRAERVQLAQRNLKHFRTAVNGAQEKLARLALLSAPPLEGRNGFR